MNRRFSFLKKAFRWLVLVIFALTVFACGGGGGGGGSSSNGGGSTKGVTYNGSTSQASITSNNAQSFYSALWGSSGSSQATASQTANAQTNSSSSLKTRSMANILELMSNRCQSDYAAFAKRSSNISNAMQAVNRTYQGSVSGTLNVSGNLDSVTKTGSVTLKYANFNDGNGVTYDGTVMENINAYDLTNDMVTDATENFTSWKIVSGTSNYTLSGSARVQQSIQNNSRTVTFNLDGRDNNTSRIFRYVNFAETIVYDNIMNPTSKTEAATGRLYVDQYGYVDFSVTSPLVYASMSQGNPASGGPIILVGAGNTKASLTPYSASYVTISVDANGDNTYESRHAYAWNNLSGAPIPVTPIAEAGPGQTVETTALVTLNGTGSVDLNGDALTYAWTITSKPTYSGATLSDATSTAPSFTADIAGSYVISLVVSNGTYTSAADTVTITATFKVTQQSPTPPLSQSVAYQMDYAHSGRVAFADTVSFPGGPAWSVTLNGTISYPVIAGGRVFVTTSMTPSGEGYGSSLYALDEMTGSVIWGPINIPVNNSYWSGLAYDNGKIFVINRNGLLKAFNAAAGQLLWSSQMPSQYSFGAPPTAVNGIIYVGGSGVGGTLYAVDESNGNVIWTVPILSDDHGSPAVSSDGVFITNACEVCKYDPISGSLLWRYFKGCSGGEGFTAAYANGVLYARDWSNSSGLTFDAATGTLIGNFTATPIPAFTTSTGFFLSSGELKGIDLGTNTVLWSFTGDGNLVSAPIVINDTVVIGSSSGNVYALNANTGTQIWSGNAGSAISVSYEGNTGLGAGEGYLVVPAGSVLTAWHISGP